MAIGGGKAARVTVRDLRTRFPAVREVLEREGEVVVTERGRDAYLLRAVDVTTSSPSGSASRKDYYARLRAIMPRPLTTAQSALLDGADRDER